MPTRVLAYAVTVSSLFPGIPLHAKTTRLLISIMITAQPCSAVDAQSVGKQKKPAWRQIIHYGAVGLMLVIHTVELGYSQLQMTIAN